MISMRPYLLRSLYEWVIDNDLTPYLLVDAEFDQIEVPRQYVENGQIILNIAPSAVQNLTLDNEWVSFNARFSGRPFSVFIPVAAVLAIYAKENGKGMFFQPEESDSLPPTSPQTPHNPPRPRRQKPQLKLVK